MDSHEEERHVSGMTDVMRDPVSLLGVKEDLPQSEGASVDDAFLQKQLHLAEDLVVGYRASARLHSLRSDGMFSALASERHYRHLERTSLSWKVTMPLRAVRSLAAGRMPSGRPVKEVVQRVREIAQDEGWRGVAERLHARLPDIPRIGVFGRKSVRSLSRSTEKESRKRAEDVYLSSLPARTTDDFQPLFLIIAELSIPQCAKYRVWQRQEALESLGWRVVVVEWYDITRALSLLQVCTRVVFYRVPGNKDGMQLIDEAHRLSLSPWWEVDDLIFDPASYEKNTNLKTLSGAERRNVLEGVANYRKALLACGRAIASTRGLADAMRQAGVNDVAVIENALDVETLTEANALRAQPAQAEGEDQSQIVVFYGSGTKTHDMDFRVAAPGILAAMQANPRIRLQIVGDLTLPSEFDALGDRVERLQGRSYAAYLQLLAQADIAIAPLEPGLFNDAKSNIKYLEAAVLAVPSVCSPAQAFADVIETGTNGYLAASPEDWKTALLALADNTALRHDIGEKARADILARYRPQAVAQQQVLPAFGAPVKPDYTRPRLMVVNVFFEPRSFGGATLVAEEMAKAMQQRGMDVAVMTSRPSLEDLPNSALRYQVHDMQALSVPVPEDPIAGLDNPAIGEIFRSWVQAWQPEIVHFHATQGLGTSLVRVCQELGVPYIVTLHDAWWLCDRQFMVQKNGRYCFQKTIDLRVCETCVPGARHLSERMLMMQECLKYASRLLSPSRSHLELYAANSVPADRLVVNRNGFVWPKRPHLRRKPGVPVRFGYVGGNEAVKGFPLVRKAFEALERTDWELVLVDNTLKLGFKSIDTRLWKVGGKVEVIPSYTPEEVDDFFDRIDVLLFPSQWKESFGLTVREALARDVWVVTTAPGGQSEDVVDGVNGTYIELDGQSEGLRRAISSLLENAAMLENYENPLKGALPTYSAQADQLLSLYEEVLSEEKQSRVCL
ncbi:glycosyltransferase [Acetobacter sp.]|uniref:glycosyltransferase n=1 Tax=Acetobacter sp. TaxID=440 RepID=UPI002586FEFD|nr:glycosyltransferase [Acetobacter sp.]MCC6104054.1 glycosyltransferase [Acetobacter sp.]